jgi:L-phenylalanine/L-methionine N-acetyltransferase
MTITIRRARVEDAAAIAALMNDPAVYPGLMQMPYASEELHRGRLVDSLAPGKADVLLVAERAGEVVGSCGMHPAGASPRRRHVMSLGMSVRADAQGQGVGSALLQALCDYADHWVGLLRLELDVYADNERAIALYRRFGFDIEGRHRGYALRDGGFVDSYSMARLHPRPPAIAAVAPSDPT